MASAMNTWLFSYAEQWPFCNTLPFNQAQFFWHLYAWTGMWRSCQHQAPFILAFHSRQPRLRFAGQYLSYVWLRCSILIFFFSMVILILLNEWIKTLQSEMRLLLLHSLFNLPILTAIFMRMALISIQIGISCTCLVISWSLVQWCWYSTPC